MFVLSKNFCLYDMLVVHIKLNQINYLILRHELRKTFFRFYCTHFELVSKYNTGLRSVLHQGLSEPRFYGDFVH